MHAFFEISYIAIDCGQHVSPSKESGFGTSTEHAARWRKLRCCSRDHLRIPTLGCSGLVQVCKSHLNVYAYVLMYIPHRLYRQTFISDVFIQHKLCI